jgi:transcriptional regulator with XRE-family HTH domain
MMAKRAPARRGDRIKAVRERRGYTQAQLGGLVGVSRNTINRVENHLAGPSLRLLEKLAVVLKVKLTDLV